ncbi:DmpA/ArgJ-like protein [Cylindrobasidium torrendii FP15055 ss-10]|uniref:DmpA/ArgJ-like protein n=1 Tax=Cylindrobasidium torrendii FP15055 ss-10 TaxID=1314674 RepID=A0A0D7BUX5_9AGAR|nr:DmpA/ArgJ-like protein [Cylindrobasidium torrendii FP15055 ss-10]
MAPRSRIRDLGYAPGQEWLSPGSGNSITDVPGVQVGTYTRHEGVWDPEHPKAKLSRTGVTIICPRPQDTIWTHPVYASIGVLNGTGEMTNSHMIKETGYLYTPLALTDTMHVGAVHTGVLKHLYERAPKKDKEGRERAPFYLPCVAETSDCLSTPDTFHLEPENVLSAFDDIASSMERLNGAPRPAHEFEGVKGGGTGMLCLGHKGGNGTSSRLLPIADGNNDAYTLGCFVQCNFGAARDLTIGGAKIGRKLCQSGFHGKEKQDAENALVHEDDGIGNEGSILVVLATDAPLLPYQLDRLLRRIPIGLSRVGCASHQYSGDIGLAFSTQTTIPPPKSSEAAGLEQVGKTTATTRKHGPLNLPKVSTHAVQTVDDASMNLLFYAAADVVEEAVLNALCTGTDQEGVDGFKVKGLDHDIVAKLLKEEGVSK